MEARDSEPWAAAAAAAAGARPRVRRPTRRPARRRLRPQPRRVPNLLKRLFVVVEPERARRPRRVSALAREVRGPLLARRRVRLLGLGRAVLGRLPDRGCLSPKVRTLLLLLLIIIMMIMIMIIIMKLILIITPLRYGNLFRVPPYFFYIARAFAVLE